MLPFTIRAILSHKKLYHVRFSLKGEDSHGDHGLGSWKKLGLRPPLATQIHLSFHHHSYRDNVTAPTGRPNLRSGLHFSHSAGGGKTTKSERTCGGIGGKNTKNLSSIVCKGKLSLSAVDFPRPAASELILSRRCKLHGSSDKR